MANATSRRPWTDPVQTLVYRVSGIASGGGPPVASKSRHDRLRVGMPTLKHWPAQPGLSGRSYHANRPCCATDCETAHWTGARIVLRRRRGSPGIEADRFRTFLGNIVEQDEAGVLERIVWDELLAPIRVLLSNRYVYRPFWLAVWDTGRGGDWRRRFEDSRRIALAPLSSRNVSTVLAIVFDRLYTLRRQIFHGGTTQRPLLQGSTYWSRRCRLPRRGRQVSPLQARRFAQALPSLPSPPSVTRSAPRCASSRRKWFGWRRSCTPRTRSWMSREKLPGCWD